MNRLRRSHLAGAVAAAVGAAVLPLAAAQAGAATPQLTGPPVSSAQAATLSEENCTSAGPTAADAQVAQAISSQINTPRMVGIDAGQVSCARAIVGAARAQNLIERAAVIAVTTAMTESTLHDYTSADDADSLGLYQQRPSQGWGTPAQVENPVYATDSFLTHMENAYPNNSWQSGDIGDICQTVQVSADPGAYDPEAPAAQIIVDQLWTMASTTLPSSPIAQYGSQLEVYRTNGGSADESNVYTPSSGWSGWYNLAGAAIIDPTAVSYGQQMQVYGRDSAGTVYGNVYTPNGGWSGWTSLGGTLASDPVAVEYDTSQYGPQMELFGIAGNGHTYSDVYTSSAGKWSGWVDLQGNLTGNVSAVQYGQQMQLYGRDSAGATYSNVYTPGKGWTGWVSLGGSLTSDPVAVDYDTTDYGNQMELFGIAGNGQAYSDVYTSSTGKWSGWVGLGGGLTGELSVAQYGQQLQVYGRDSAGAIYSDVYTPGGNWTGWKSLGGTISGNPVAIEYSTSTYGNQLEVYGQAANGGTYSDVYTSYTGKWSGWTGIGGN